VKSRRSGRAQGEAAWAGGAPATEEEFEALRREVADALDRSARVVESIGREMQLRGNVPGPGWRQRALGVTLQLLHINSRLLTLALALHGTLLAVDGPRTGALSLERSEDYVKASRRLIDAAGGKG
jgi:hypothetical protein